MKYTVVWSTSAMNHLAEIWNQASDRQAVSQASNRIDRLLRIDPDQQGYVYLGRRALVQRPLAVTFAVHPDDRLVEVLQVRRV